ncbi:MAG: 5-(carboxyamino)imidazole ribonucleotide synthase [bacterium]
MNCLNQKLGIIGGGQLGKMMILEAKKMGLHVTILDPTKDCPASSIADEHIVANFNDREALLKLANSTDVLTYEFEHIDYLYLMELEKNNYKVYPTPTSLKIIQNKFTQKVALKENNILVPEFRQVESVEDIKKIGKEFSYPMLLKTCTGGYDGKGNFVIKSEEQVEEGFNALNNGAMLMVEKFVDFEMELSVLACGGLLDEIKIYPVAHNIHIDNILHKTIVPAKISEKSEQKAIDIAHEIIKIFKGVGMFCVEFFITSSGEVIVNEIAPRPHNSGHYTIEGCITSQFENHVRAVLNMPLGSTQLLKPSVMMNLLGEENYKGDAIVEGVSEALKIQNSFLHIYGKKQTVPKRKMGHITCIGDNLEDANKNADKVFNFIKIISE